jgi:hypothetical protein
LPQKTHLRIFRGADKSEARMRLWTLWVRF